MIQVETQPNKLHCADEITKQEVSKVTAFTQGRVSRTVSQPLGEGVQTNAPNPDESTEKDNNKLALCHRGTMRSSSNAPGLSKLTC